MAEYTSYIRVSHQGFDGTENDDLALLSRENKYCSQIVEFADKELKKFKEKIKEGFIFEEFLGWTVQEKDGLWYVAIKRNNQFCWGHASASSIENVHPGWNKREMFRWLKIEAQRQKYSEIFGNW